MENDIVRFRFDAVTETESYNNVILPWTLRFRKRRCDDLDDVDDEDVRPPHCSWK